MKKILLVTVLSATLTACFGETEGKDVEPESMADCITIENPNNRDICKMKYDEKVKERRLESLGDRKLKVIDW